MRDVSAQRLRWAGSPNQGTFARVRANGTSWASFPSLSTLRHEIIQRTSQMITPLTFVGDDYALIDALREGHPGAVAVLHDRHAPHLLRTLQSVLGADGDLPDILQEVFLRAIDGISSLDDPDRLRGWLTSIAVFTARAYIRRRTRRAWLNRFLPQRVLASHVDPPSTEAREALRETYELLDDLPVDERMAFVLRIVDGMTLSEAAEACHVSLATFKRRLTRAERRFLEAANQRPSLEQWLKNGTRWKLRKQS
jgi:RNA polymerase sigma-70 factor, ECF subfamily